MKSKKNYAYSILFLIALILITFYWFFQEYNLQETLSAIKQARLSVLCIAIASNLLFLVCEAANLSSLLKSLECKTSFHKCLKYVFVECYFCAITPSASGGQPAQMVYMHDDGIPFSKSTLSLLMIAITYKGSLLLYAFVFFLAAGSNGIAMMGKLQYLFYLGVAMNIAAVVFMIMALFSAGLIEKVAKWFVQLLHKIHIIRHTEKWDAKIEYTIQEYQEGAVYIRGNLGLFTRVFVITIIQRFLRFCVTYLIFRAFRLSNYSMITIVLLQSAVSISADMLPIPGAVGISETCYMKIFKEVFTKKYILPSMVLSRGISFYGMVLLSSIVVIIAQIRKMQRKEQNQ